MALIVEVFQGTPRSVSFPPHMEMQRRILLSSLSRTPFVVLVLETPIGVPFVQENVIGELPGVSSRKEKPSDEPLF